MYMNSGSLRRKVRPFFLNEDETGNYPLKYIYDILGWAITLFLVDFAGIAFLFLELSSVLIIWNSLIWLGPIINVSAFLLLQVFPAPKQSLSTPKK